MAAKLCFAVPCRAWPCSVLRLTGVHPPTTHCAGELEFGQGQVRTREEGHRVETASLPGSVFCVTLVSSMLCVCVCVLQFFHRGGEINPVVSGGLGMHSKRGGGAHGEQHRKGVVSPAHYRRVPGETVLFWLPLYYWQCYQSGPLAWLGLAWPGLAWLVPPCLALPCLALPCPALPCPALFNVLSLAGSDVSFQRYMRSVS